MQALGHDITAFEPEAEWSIDNLRTEPRGEASLNQFLELYSEMDIQTYAPDQTEELWREHLRGVRIVILHEWNPPSLARLMLHLRDELGFKLLFHDTHHRASSSPEAFTELGLSRFDGVIAFGEVLSRIYRERFALSRVWTLHEAADTTIFKPLSRPEPATDVVWIGNWGDGERATELREFLTEPAAALRPNARVSVYGVRYPQDGLAALQDAGIFYGGYLPNLEAPAVYARAHLTLHVPRQQYSTAMPGIPTIRVFEALACGIPLISAPWQDSENLFRPGDYQRVSTGAEMRAAIQNLLANPSQAADQAARGLETVLAHHTCDHRARELTDICQQVLL